MERLIIFFRLIKWRFDIIILDTRINLNFITEEDFIETIEKLEKEIKLIDIKLKEIRKIY